MLALLKKNRNWALWLSGFFGIGSLSNLVLAIMNAPIVTFGITLDRNIYLLRFVVHGIISYLLLRYWEAAQVKDSRRQRKRR